MTEVTVHRYEPSVMHMGDCRICGHIEDALHHRLAKAEADCAALREACCALLGHWDRFGEREKRVPPDGERPGYWSPSEAMVESKYMAELRKALSSTTAGQTLLDERDRLREALRLLVGGEFLSIAARPPRINGEETRPQNEWEEELDHRIGIARTALQEPKP